MEFVYKLTHAANIEPNRFTYVSSNLPQEDFEKLVAFIEFKCADLDECYGMDQEEIAEVLCELYGSELLTEKVCPNAIKIDHYITWEKYCGSEVEDIEEFQREDLKLMLEYYVERFYSEQQK